MQPTRYAIALIIASLTFTACFHATVRTGATPGDAEINQPWATSLVYGLVPPPDVKTAEDCPNGIAVVETQRTFLNSLVGILTLGIYTPMAIKVTCAASSTQSQDDAVDLEVAEGGTDREVVATLERAADLSRKEGRAVSVRF